MSEKNQDSAKIAKFPVGETGTKPAKRRERTAEGKLTHSNMGEPKPSKRSTAKPAKKTPAKKKGGKGSYGKTRGRPPGVTPPKRDEVQIEAALRAADGMLTIAAKALGISYPTLRKYVEASEHLKAVQEEASLGLLDEAEGELAGLIRQNLDYKAKTTAIIFFLKTKGKGRGYVEKEDVAANAEVHLHFDKRIENV